MSFMGLEAKSTKLIVKQGARHNMQTNKGPNSQAQGARHVALFIKHGARQNKQGASHAL
jgi:hypothetical protein